jgi:hypothetical protein
MYWILFLYPMLAAFGGDRGPRDGAHPGRLTPAWINFWILLVVVIGLRERVGGDWYNYLGHLREAQRYTLSELLTQSDPGYKFLNWLSLQFDWGIYGVNLLAAMVFATGLVQFCRGLPRPWLAATASVPYLVIVVAMGYTRQGIALGLVLLGLLALGRQAPRSFGAWVFAGAAFHRSAVLMLPIAALTVAKRRLWVAFWIAVLAGVGYLAFVEQDAETLYTNYVRRGYESQGAFIRLAMNAVAAVLLLVLGRRMQMPPAQRALWRWMSLLALAMFAAFFVAGNASTALDRLGLYLLPLQLVAFAHLPSVFARSDPRPLIAAVVAYFGAVLAVWLNYAANAYAWLPYRIHIFGS